SPADFRTPIPSGRGGWELGSSVVWCCGSAVRHFHTLTQIDAARAQAPPRAKALRMVGTREGRRLLHDPLTRFPCGAPRALPTLRRLTSRQNQECATVARDMTAGSIRLSRRRASRERWSSSTLDTLRLHRLMLGMPMPPSLHSPCAPSRAG